jgi:antitoxin component YwqK of YwqJK toxin-antitoxin module
MTMRKYLLLFNLFIFVNSLCIFAIGNDTTNYSYFNKLKTILIKDTEVLTVKLVEQHYFNGDIQTQRMFVKYRSDTTKRFWEIGKYYCYYKNGKLAEISNIDLTSRMLIDTTYTYDENGILIQLIVYDNFSKQVPVKLVMGLTDIFFKYWQNWPSKYTIISLSNGLKNVSLPYIYVNEQGWLLDGDVIYYKADGTIDKAVKYSMGKEVTAP